MDLSGRLTTPRRIQSIMFLPLPSSESPSCSGPPPSRTPLDSAAHVRHCSQTRRGQRMAMQSQSLRFGPRCSTTDLLPLIAVNGRLPAAVTFSCRYGARHIACV